MSMNLTVLSTTPLLGRQAEWIPVAERPIIGKDILELLSSSMYVNPLSIYREYIQNAADSIDDARRLEILPLGAGRVDITVDHQLRKVRIRDNGTGLPSDEFVDRLVAFGASRKRGSYARGFRGVGRLAGLGYCQELIFRSRVKDQAKVCELRWDCRKLKTLLRDPHLSKTLEALVRDIVTTRSLSSVEFPKRFFEVELVGIIRHGKDALLDEQTIHQYLSQVAPVPFASEFALGRQIEQFLGPKVALGNVEIRINAGRPIRRPHRSEFEIKKGVTDRFDDLQTIVAPSVEGNVAALGWLLHHNYLGALPTASGLSGLRLRRGNMQVGEASVLDEMFPESRFNSWTVGEIHIVDDRILPNGRRDNFEPNVHFQNVLNQLVPLGRELARRCRMSSIRRNRMKQFELLTASMRGSLAVLRQGAVSREERSRIRGEVQAGLNNLQKIANMAILGSEVQGRYTWRAKRLASDFTRLFRQDTQNRRIAQLGRSQRRLLQRICDIIYQSSANTSAARSLVERILKRL